ncbi:MAG: PD-(D/E)XK nuclease domain-containing protein, partial [Phocaeicola sp.]
MDIDYATMFGFTQAELESHFGDRIAEFARRENLSTEDMTLKIKSWYNGYRFHPKADTVYNPVSAGRFMNHGEFNNWWFETGSPSFLIQQLRKKPIGYFDMLERAIPADFVGSFDPAKIDARSLLFQTGYLTIVDADNEDDMGWWFILGFPNKEVELSLSTHLVAELGTGDSSESLYAARILSRAIRRGDTQAVIDAIHSHLAAIPYDSPVLNEGNFKSLLFLLLRMAGVAIAAEHYTNKGRLDMVVHSPDHIYLFELKHNSSSQEAMDQIHRKRYYEQFVGSGKQLHLIALNYSPEERNIATDWIEETL